MQRHYVMNSARVLLAVLQAAVTYVALTRWPGSGLVWLSAILLGASILQFGFFAVWSLARKPAPSIRAAHVNRSTIRELYAFGMKSVTLMASTRIAAGSVPIVMGWILGAGQIVFYAIPNRLALYAAGLGAALGFPLMPYFSALDGKGDRAATLKAWFTATRALQFAMVGMAVGMLGLGGPFIARWIGPGYGEQGAWVIRCLGAALLVEAVSPNSSRLLVSMNRHGRPAALALLIAVLGVPITILLAKVAGVPGVGLSVLLIRASTEIAWFILALHAIGVGVGEHLRRTTLTFAPAGLLFAAVLFGLRRLHEADDYPRLAGYALAGGAAYALGVWLFALHGRERAAVLEFLGGVRRRGATVTR
jgi:O-antigen/teichoic acid export membrane protein